MKNKIFVETRPIEVKHGKSFTDEVTYDLTPDGIYELTTRCYFDEMKGDKLKVKRKITSAVISKVELITYSQIDEPYYIVHCEDFNNRYKFFGNSDKIVKKFKKVLNITTSYKLKDIINEIFSTISECGEMKKIHSRLPSGAGLFFNDDHVKSVLLDELIENKNEQKDRKDKAKIAMKELDNIFNFYSNSKKDKLFLHSIYATGIYSVFSFLRKQKGLQTPSVIIEGATNTGKTAVASLVLYTYGITKRNKFWINCMTSGSDMRVATLDKLSKCTLPIFFDESKLTLNKISGVSNSEDAAQLSEMLKIASDGTSNQPVRSIMVDGSSRMTKEIYCSRSMFFISNYSVTEFRGDAWKKRILIFESDSSMSKGKSKSSIMGKKLSDFEFQETMRDLGEWIIYDLIHKKTYSELKKFLKDDFFESSKFFFNYIREELGFKKVSFQDDEDIWDSQQNITSINIKQFLKSKIDNEAERVKNRLRQTIDIDKRLEREYNKRNIVLEADEFQKSLADNIMICLINDSLNFLKGLSTQPKVILMKNAFISNYSKYANYLNKHELENGAFEKTFLTLSSSEKKTKDSFRVDGKTMSASTIRLSFYDFLEFLTSKHSFDEVEMKKNKKEKKDANIDEVFDYINESKLNQTSIQELKEMFVDVDSKLTKLLDQGRIIQVKKGYYYAI